MARIGIYGGTFNPPHAGHVSAAKHAFSALNLSQLLVIPSFLSPGKQPSDDAVTPAQRLEMTKLAFHGIAGVQVSDIELQRGGVSYTFDTVQALQAAYPQQELVLLIGTDMFLSFQNWHRWQDLLKAVSLAVLCRNDHQNAQVQSQRALLEQQGAQIYMVDNPVVEMSSTDVRRMLAFQCADEYLCPGVLAYIRSCGLYGAERDYHSLSAQQLEQAVVSLLKPNRVAHVLGCRDAAIQLARRWGANEDDAQRAALLHDITKALDGPAQLTLCRAYGIVLDDFSTENPKTLHALTGALVAQRVFGENTAVVEAIASHTTGKADMDVLEKIIYVADYMEPNRAFPGVEALRALAYSDLDEALRMGLEMTLEVLRKENKQISPGSQAALAWLDAQKKL